jgi:hypothetical protein
MSADGAFGSKLLSVPLLMSLFGITVEFATRSSLVKVVALFGSSHHWIVYFFHSVFTAKAPLVWTSSLGLLCLGATLWKFVWSYKVAYVIRRRILYPDDTRGIY